MGSVTVNGVDLSTVASGVSTRTGWRSYPGVRATSIAPSNTDGILVPDRRAPLEPGQFALSMWVRGRDHGDFTANVDTLMAIFHTPRGTVPVVLHTDPGEGVSRTCQARTVAAWPVEHKSPLHAEFRVVMEIPAGAWTSHEYVLTRRQNDYGHYPPIAVDCGDPTTTIVDAVVLVRDPGDGVLFYVFDGNVDVLEQQRIQFGLTLAAPVATNRSLLFDLGRWAVYTVARPAADDVTPAWFDSLPATVSDYTGQVTRRGPMFGRALLPLEPGMSPIAPRIPAVAVDMTDTDHLPAVIPDVTVAMRPRWL